MSFRTIVVHVRPGRDAREPGFAQALALAATHGARLTALVHETEGVPLAIDGMTIRAPAAGDAVESPDAAATGAALIRAGTEKGVPIETITTRDLERGVADGFADAVRLGDLAVLTVPAPTEVGRRFMVEAALFRSGRPLLLVPVGAPPAGFARVLIGWDETPGSVRAIHEALPILKKADAVCLVSIHDDKPFPNAKSGLALAGHLARHDVNASFMEVARGGLSVAKRFAALAEEEQASLVVMGAYAHARLRDLIFGSATRDVVAGALPVAAFLTT